MSGAVGSDPTGQAFQANMTFPGALPPTFLRLWMASSFREIAKVYPPCRLSLPELQMI